MIRLGEIIINALEIVEDQTGEKYDKYLLEDELGWKSNRKVEGNIMPQILLNWGIDCSSVVLINCIHHDVLTVAYEFQSVEHLEEELKGSQFYLNPFLIMLFLSLRGR